MHIIYNTFTGIQVLTIYVYTLHVTNLSSQSFVALVKDSCFLTPRGSTADVISVILVYSRPRSTLSPRFSLGSFDNPGTKAIATRGKRIEANSFYFSDYNSPRSCANVSSALTKEIISICSLSTLEN